MSVKFRTINVLSGTVIVSDVVGNPESIHEILIDAAKYATDAQAQLRAQRIEAHNQQAARSAEHAASDEETARRVREAAARLAREQ